MSHPDCPPLTPSQGRCNGGPLTVLLRAAAPGIKWCVVSQERSVWTLTILINSPRHSVFFCCFFFYPDLPLWIMTCWGSRIAFVSNMLTCGWWHGELFNLAKCSAADRLSTSLLCHFSIGIHFKFLDVPSHQISDYPGREPRCLYGRTQM